jgi:hypothetical protein
MHTISRRVKCIKSGKIYQSPTHLSKAINISINTIQAHLNGRVKSAKGFKYKYIDEKLYLKCLNDGNIFKSVAQFSRYYKVSHCMVLNQLQKGKSNYKGLEFEYCPDEPNVSCLKAEKKLPSYMGDAREASEEDIKRLERQAEIHNKKFIKGYSEKNAHDIFYELCM